MTESIQMTAGQALVERGLTIATAESCTGGLVAARLVDYPGISACLGEAHVTYANAAKVRYCGVNPETLAMHGAVSPEVAREMAEGLRERCGSDIAAATTGIAGPGGGTKEKPVGLVYICVAAPDRTEVEELRLQGSRQEIRSQAADSVLTLILRAAQRQSQKG